jgi:chorismate mutase
MQALTKAYVKHTSVTSLSLYIGALSHFTTQEDIMILQRGYFKCAIFTLICMSASCQAFASPSISKSSSSVTTPPSWNSRLSATSVDGDITTAAKDKVTTSDVLSLDSIRSTLIRQEETIIFALIERAQYRQNAAVYVKKDNLGVPPGSIAPEDGDKNLSFLEYMLIGTEALHYAVRRYTSPEENAFFPDRLPAQKILDELEFPNLLSNIDGACDVNFNEILLKKYTDFIVPSITVSGDDEQHGSSVLCDVAVLQALSKRVHYGKFVAESKYLADPESYQKLVHAGDADGVMKLLTNAAVEAKVLRRAMLKAATYGREPLLADFPPLEHSKQNASIVAAAAAAAVVFAIEAMGEDENSWDKVCPTTVESVYRDIIIPLTKDIEVAYLFRRCGKEPPPEFAPHRMSTDDL